jgi:hypothetical protein
MTKDQMKMVRDQYPHEVELVMSDLYDNWSTSQLVNEMLRWMPKSEFMKLVYQMEDLADEE